MKEECRTARAVICHQHGQTRPHLQSTYSPFPVQKPSPLYAAHFTAYKCLDIQKEVWILSDVLEEGLLSYVYSLWNDSIVILASNFCVEQT